MITIDKIKKHSISEKAGVDFRPDLLMTGEERYPVLCSSLSPNIMQDTFAECLSKCKGLYLYASCLEKAKIVKNVVPMSTIVYGAVRILSFDGKGAYGFDYNPPNEFHCWNVLPRHRNAIIIDLSLPGLILRGLNMSDEIGPYLVGNTPIILSDTAPDWAIYEPKCFVFGA